MIDLREIDWELIEISRRIKFYSMLTPKNRGEEEKRFFEAIREGKVYDPVYMYKTSPFDDEQRDLEKMRGRLDKDDDLHQLFIRKIDFILTQLELLKCGDDTFTDTAIKLYGRPDEECVDSAFKIISSGKNDEGSFPEETVTPEEMVSILRKTLREKGVQWEVILTDKIVPKMTVSGRDRAIYVNGRINYIPEEVQRLKIHEIEVHVFRGENGYAQPFNIFAEGLAAHDEAEEGLAVTLEEASGCLEIDKRQIRLYAGRAFCVDRCLRSSFYEAFMKVREYFPDELAYRLVERGKRGLRDTSRHGGITKDSHYISGWRKVRRYIEKGGDLSILYACKVGFKDIDIVNKLINRGILKPPGHLPEFIRSGPKENQ